MRESMLNRSRSSHLNSTIKCPILMYHGIASSAGEFEVPYCCHPVLFSEHINYLHSEGYDFISLSDLYAYMNCEQQIPKMSVVITFDDGFRSVYENAFPVLKKYNIPATVFVVADLVGTTNKWEVDGFPIRSLMSWDQIREMNDHGIEIGGHGCTHQPLAKIADSIAQKEITRCKKVIEQNLDIEVRHFSYPHGNMSDSVRNMVHAAGYLTACSIIPGFNFKSTDPYVLRRIEVRGPDSVRQLRRKMYYGTNDGSWSCPFRQIKKRIMAVFEGGNL